VGGVGSGGDYHNVEGGHWCVDIVSFLFFHSCFLLHDVDCRMNSLDNGNADKQIGSSTRPSRHPCRDGRNTELHAQAGALMS
jgi:hypothetical protein